MLKHIVSFATWLDTQVVHTSALMIASQLSHNEGNLEAPNLEASGVAVVVDVVALVEELSLAATPS